MIKRFIILPFILLSLFATGQTKIINATHLQGKDTTWIKSLIGTGGGGDTLWTETGGTLTNTTETNSIQLRSAFSDYSSDYFQDWSGWQLYNGAPIYRAPIPGSSINSITDSITQRAGILYRQSGISASEEGVQVSEFYNGQVNWFGLSGAAGFEGSLIGQSGVNHDNRMNLGHSGVPFGVAYLDSAHVNGTIYANAIQITKSGRAPVSTFAGIDPYGLLKDKYIVATSPVRVTEIGDSSSISMPPAGTGTDGYLDSTSYDRFNNKVSSPFTFDSTATDQTISRTAPGNVAIELKSTGDDQASLTRYSTGNGSHTAQVGIYGPYANGLDLSTSGADVINFRQNNVLKAQVTGAGDFSVTNGLNVGGTVTGSKMVGGAGVGSFLTLQSTTGAGTTTGVGVQVAVGTAGATKAITVLNDGKMGIGKTNPGELLDVNGRIRAASLIQASGGLGTLAGGFCTLSTNDVGFFGNVSTGNASAVSFWSKNLERMRLDPSGNLGINTTNPTAKVHISSTATALKATGTGADSVTVGVDKGLRLYGDVTVFEDLRIDGLVPGGGTAEPALTNNFGGVSGMYQRQFQGSVRDDEVYFNIQMPHAWKEGGKFEIHLHTAPWTTPVVADSVSWQIAYNWQNINGTFGAVTTDTVVQRLNGVAQWQHKLIELINLDAVAVGKTLSSIITCRLRRLANSSTSDTYTGGMTVLYIDAHVEIDGLGSSQELIK